MRALLRGTAGKSNSFEGLAPGTRRSQGWFYTVAGGHSQDPIQRVVMTESAIDALFYQTLHPPGTKTLYLSTDGAGFVPVEQLQRIPQITIALDRDPAGEEIVNRLIQYLPHARCDSPIYKDWNEDLNAVLKTFQKQINEQKQNIYKKSDKNKSLGLNLW